MRFTTKDDFNSYMDEICDTLRIEGRASIVITDQEYGQVFALDPKVLPSMNVCFQGAGFTASIYSNYQWQVKQEVKRQFKRETIKLK